MLLNEEEHDRAYEYYISLDTRRWHTKREIPIQTVKEHTVGMLLLLDVLHPNPSANLMRAILRHDAHENISFDAPHELKNRYPVLREIDAQADAEFHQQFGIPQIQLTEDEELWLSYLDGLEVLFFIDANVQHPSQQSMEIYDNQMRRCIEFESMLKKRGFFAEAHETVQ